MPENPCSACVYHKDQRDYPARLGYHGWFSPYYPTFNCLLCISPTFKKFKSFSNQTVEGVMYGTSTQVQEVSLIS